MKFPTILFAVLACAPFINAQPGSITPLGVGNALSAPATGLIVGEKAPEFKPTAWIQGEPVTSFEKGKTYLIECWATWCGPCIAQIPHLTQLQKDYGAKGLVVIGTNVWDKDAANAAAFVKKQGDKMPYRVVFDNKADGLVTRNWVSAGSVTGIPYAFVVRDGILIWRGYPWNLSDVTIEAMLAGTFDIVKAEKERQVRSRAEAEQRKKERDEDEAARQRILSKFVIGKEVPEFKPAAWIQGAPVTKWEKGKVYLIHCWATWFDSRTGQSQSESVQVDTWIPILTKFHNKYESKGLVVIGTNVWEQNAANVTGLIGKQGDKLPYRVAFDDKDGQVSKNWITQIPDAFAVRDGVLLWRGNMESLNDATIESMLAGTFKETTPAATR